MAKWFVAAKKADFNEIGRRFGISPVLARIIRNRDVIGEDAIDVFLHGGREDLSSPERMKGIPEAAALVRSSIRNGRHIRVIGDYDVDGVCATCILKKGMRFLGACVDDAIPHRVRDGYGLNNHLVQDAKADGVDVIVTCDNGIAAADSVALAKSLGMAVVVTDHHELPFEEADGSRRFLLPPADVVVDPKQPEETFPFPNVCGATVAWELVRFLLCGEGNVSAPPAGTPSGLLDELLELAAFATICDVMPLLGENRTLVREGLRLMQDTRNIGLRALMEVTGVLPGSGGRALSAYHVGFVLGPCLNASGRLDSAGRALALLESTDRREAVRLAASLKSLNDSRKQMTEAFVSQAEEMVDRGEFSGDRVLVVYLPECHESVAGIIAGRLRERYYRPVFVLTNSEEGVKGSGRSIEAYHMYDEMTKCSHFFTRYGGHKMAAGLSMREADIGAFRRELNDACTLTAEDLEERVHIDVALPVSRVTFSLAQEMEMLEPFGAENPRPLFAQKDLRFASARAMGKSGNALRFTVRDDQDAPWEMVYFDGKEDFDRAVCEKCGEKALHNLYQGRDGDVRMDVAYYPAINTWQGSRRLQLVMKHYR